MLPLNEYDKKEITDLLLLLLSVAREELKRKGICVRSANKWAERANEALKDIEFEETKLPFGRGYKFSM
jgi:hypothetical protein